MYLTTLTLAALVAAVGIALLLRRSCDFLLSLHLVQFWVLVFLFEGVSLLIADSAYTIEVFILAVTVCLAYMVVFALGFQVIHALTTRSDLPDDPVFETALNRLRPKHVFLVLGVWLAFKTYLVVKYGEVGFNILATRQAIGADVLDVALNSMLTYPAVGGFVVLLIRWGWGLDRRNLLAIALAFGFLLLYVLTGEVSGVRRFIIALSVIVLLSMGYARGFRVSAKQALWLVVLAGVVAMLSQFYLNVRGNLSDRRVQVLMRSGEPSAIAEGFQLLFDPNLRGSPASLRENLQERYSPFTVVYDITFLQLDSSRSTNGQIWAQSFANAVPFFLVPDKQNVNADQILASVFGFPLVDLPAGVLALSQAEFSFPGILLAPGPYLLMFLWGYILLRSRNPLVLLAAIGTITLGAAAVEEVFDTFIVALRDLLVIVCLAKAFELVWNCLPRRGPLGSNART